eukprot:TRINITY_DN34642_c0_g1_i1.p1 TRINITY_DN34642_c0_g1~~TRINITY_DN34642_c0_g1_i1.p1  ORF type:complete len:433 (-),score=26.53 TRINITY_DN34642_c0_g1_i1:663-1961(-)
MPALDRPRSAPRGGRPPSPKMRLLTDERQGESDIPKWGASSNGLPLNGARLGLSPSPKTRSLTHDHGQLTANATKCTSPTVGRPPVARPPSRGQSPSAQKTPCGSPGIGRPPRPTHESGGYTVSGTSGPPVPAASPGIGRPPRPSQESASFAATWSPSSSVGSGWLGRPPKPVGASGGYMGSAAWASSSSTHIGRPHSPSLRLAPLSVTTSMHGTDRGRHDQRMPSPLARALDQQPQPSWRCGILQSIRRSTPSPTRASCPSEARQSANVLPAPWEKQNEFSEKELPSDSASSFIRQGSPDVRIGRRRVSSEFARGSAAQRGRSCSERVGGPVPQTHGSESTVARASGTTSHAVPSRRLVRCGSVPPTGTEKADDAASAQGKIRAIAMLKQLFEEEMAKGCQDPNAAAAKALSRLNQIPQKASAPTSCQVAS